MAGQEQAYCHFVGERFDIPVEPILRLQGYRDLERVRPQIRQIAARMARLAGTVMAPQAYYRRVAVASCTPGALVIEPDTTFHSAAFSKDLAGCREAVVFVLTLGNELDAASERFVADEEVVEALFLEAAGWIAVERATRDFVRHLWRGLAGQRLSLTRRLGPGYADWPLEEQTALFALLDSAPLPVRLLESCAMVPKKSRSGLFGLRPSG